MPNPVPVNGEGFIRLIVSIGKAWCWVILSVSASFASFESCEQHTIYREVAVTWLAYSRRHR